MEQSANEHTIVADFVEAIRTNIEKLKAAAVYHEGEAAACLAAIRQLRESLEPQYETVASPKPPRRKRRKREPGLPDPREPLASDTVQR